MRQILEVEDHVAVPPMMFSDPFYRITYLIKEEIRRFKWLQGEKGRQLSWPEARDAWTKAHRKEYETFLLEMLSFPAVEQTKQDVGHQSLPGRSARLWMLPHRA